LRVAEAELVIALRVSIEKGSYAEFLRESTKLTERCRTFKEVDEVGFDPSLREEAKSLAGIGALLDSKDLYFQTLTPKY
jgi:hypothetical protein